MLETFGYCLRRHLLSYCLCALVSMDFGFVECDTIFQVDDLVLDRFDDQIPTATNTRAMRIEIIQEDAAHLSNRRSVSQQFSIPSYTQLNSSNTIYPDLAIRASDGSYLVTIICLRTRC
jgi:hypothetical protein